MHIHIDAQTGEITVIAHGEKDLPTLTALGLRPTHIVRGGHVWPANRCKRWLFRFLRCLPSIRLRQWTRTWRGSWQVRMVNGLVLGTFATRAEAISAEEEYLLRMLP